MRATLALLLLSGCCTLPIEDPDNTVMRKQLELCKIDNKVLANELNECLHAKHKEEI